MADRGSDTPPPAIVLGGDANALSVARSLARIGVTVYAVNEASSSTRFSRYVQWVPMPRSATFDDWAGYLFGPASDRASGAVLLAASDAALEFIAANRERLLDRYRLDISAVGAQRCMLDKLCTYRSARAAGVATPKFWSVAPGTELSDLRSQLVYPLIVKPRYSHLFEAHFGRKFFVADSFEMAVEAVGVAHSAGAEVLLMEMIPGADDQLCSFYTYLDADGEPQFRFTKRIVRRYPVNMGSATYHVTDHIPELAEPALALLKHVGVRGLANVEFKLDRRDGSLRLIECNARFTASNELLARAGFDLGTWVYRRILGEDPTMPTTYPDGMRLWSPANDVRAFMALHADGQLGWSGWIGSLMHRQAFPIFDVRDPMPSVVNHLRHARRAVDAIARR